MDRDRLFDDLLQAALQASEIADALEKPYAPTREQLISYVGTERTRLLNSAEAAEAAHQRALAALSTRRRRLALPAGAYVTVRVLAVLLPVVSLFVLGLRLSTTDANSQPKDPSIGEGFLSIASGVIITAFIAGVAALLVWVAALGLSRFTTSVTFAAARHRRLAIGAAWLSACLMGAFLSALFLPEAAWSVAHGRLRTSNGYPPSPWGRATLAIPAVYLALLLKRPNTSELSSLRQSITFAEAQWRQALSDGILSILRLRINQALQRRVSTLTEIDDASGLRTLADESYHVPTPAAHRLRAIANGMGSGCVALCGPRGAGKTTLLKAFASGTTNGDGKTTQSIVIGAPVEFDRREFMLHLYTEACDYILLHGPASLRPTATADRKWINSLQTESSQGGLSLGAWAVSASRQRSVSLAQQPLSYPAIVFGLRRLLGQITSTLEIGRTPQFVIGIDELDRIQPVERARDFLNELKAIVDIRGCLFVLSVSDEALADASLTEPSRRDLFDNIVDEVVRVGHVDLAAARQILDRRVIGLPEPFAALFYVLSGGLARDLLRTARAAVVLAEDSAPIQLEQVTAELVWREVERMQTNLHSALRRTEGPFAADLVRIFGTAEPQALLATLRELIHCADRVRADSPEASLARTLAVRALHLSTVMTFFTNGLTEDQITRASRRGEPGSIDALASVTQQGRATSATASATLAAFRSAWNLPAP